MLPFHQSTSDSDAAATGAASDSASSGDTTEPKKPSLRILDDGPPTLEEDLLHGPLLLGLSTGIEASQHEAIHSPLQMEPEPIVEGQGPPPNVFHGNPLPLIPYGFSSRHPAQSLSLSELSDTGASLSLPAGLSSTIFSQSQAGADEARRTQSASRNDVIGPIFRNYEFAWDQSGLLFGGEQFAVATAPEILSSNASPNSNVGSTTLSAFRPRSQCSLFSGHEAQHRFVGGADLVGVPTLGESWAASRLCRDLETASLTCSISSSGSGSGSRYQDLQALLSTQSGIELDKAIDRIAQLLLDDYLRSYAPQRSQKRNNTARSQGVQQVGHKSGRTGEKARTSTARAAGKSKRKTVDGAGESEDEDSHKKKQRSAGPSLLEDSRLWACPFLKWKPERYRETCDGLPLHLIRDVKRHLRDRHYRDYCPGCYLDVVGPHICRRKPGPPVGLITQDKRDELRKWSKKKKTHEEHWQHIYKVLFPNEPLCPDPFLSDPISEAIRNAEQYYRFGRGAHILRNELKDLKGLESLDDNAFEVISDHICERFVPQLLSTVRLGGDVVSPDDRLEEPAHNSHQVVEPAFPRQTLEPRAIDRDICEFVNPPGPATTVHVSPIPGLSGDILSMPQTFDGQLSIQGLSGWEPPFTPGTWVAGLTGPDSGASDVPIDSFVPFTDAELSRLVLSDIDEAYEVGNMDGSQALSM
ncbi:hypothetical protein AK830_g3411 [Neonectria ditissima]|uniref:Uncharacterized protein n=1 Tax=Neonectria ditissima TaxID=78410 RepID=A0A0P7BI14_9HYPO|nr:hypothetical protein AK830_g3411 [Neonectria ditissima]